MTTASAALTIAALALGGCDAYDRDLGATPYLCGPTAPRCPLDYTCEIDPSNGEEVCVDSRGLPGFECADDSALEPNETIAMASATTIDSTPRFSRDALAVCPASDKDVLAFSISASGKRVELTIVYQPPEALLEGGVFNAGGVPIAPLVAVSNMPDTLRATTQNLSTGMYFVQVAGVAGNKQLANYQLTIDVIGP